ncbi:putative tyrosinase protein [Eutypa lata UCREL1]|uniref:Putative tyrosinase protein n=1 Tax=Eutypa lata (strain UCR-EL1) TaxID=1287681 RepID=M7S888_EUTLA|nr:putative tyrosinase protein [Eutypa lata UCREL1]
MKSATLLQLLAGTVSLTAAKPCQKLAPFPAGFHTTTLEDALSAAVNDPGFHEYIAGLTETYNVKPGSTYKLTPEGTLAETHNGTNDGSSLIITHDGKSPTLVIGGQNGTSHNVTLDVNIGIGIGIGNGSPSAGKNGTSGGSQGGSYIANPLPTLSLPNLSLPTLSLPTFSLGTTASGPTGVTTSDSASSTIVSPPGGTTVSGASSTASGAVSSTASNPFTNIANSTASVSVSSTASGAASSTLSSSITSSTASTVASSTSSSATSSSAVPTASSGCTSPETLVEWRNMQDADKKSYVTAIRCLMDKPATGLASSATNRYEELVWAHQTQSTKIHMSSIFLPWHRYYTNVFHRLLREECSYTAPMPWWDETKDAGAFADSGLFTAEYFGAMPEVTASGLGSCISDGAFSGKRLHIGPGNSDTNHCLSRGEDKSATANVNKAYVNTCTSRSAYDDLRTCIEGGPHAYGHNGAGPIMADAISSPSDPLFFMHHTFIDWTWKTWQNKAAVRSTAISGYADQASTTRLTVNTKLSTKGVQADVTVEDILDTEGGFLCYKYDY